MRVLVCRPLADAESTARRLEEAGHEAVVAPVLAIVALAATLPRDPDALVFSSRHAVTSLAEGDVARLRSLPALAVGRATMAAARARGFTDVRTGTGDAAGLADLVRLTLPRGARLLYLAGRVHTPALPDALREQGHPLDIAEVYDATPYGPWPREVLADLAGGRLQACLHFSRRSAALALAAAEAATLATPFRALRHACLSSDVASPLVEASCPLVVVATRPDEASLLQALGHTKP